MLLTNLTRQLKATLPYYTGLFSDKIAISNLNYNPKHYQITICTAKGHNLKDGDFVIINGISNKYALSNITYDYQSEILTAILPEAHEISPQNKTVTLKGFDNEHFNGNFPVLSIKDCKLEIAIKADPLVLGVMPNGNEAALKQLPLGINNFFKVAKTIDAKEFIINNWIYNDIFDLTSAHLLTLRVAATAEDINKLKANETKNRSYIYTVLTKVDINKASNTMDFEMDTNRFMLGYEVTVYAVLPVLKTDNTGYKATDLMLKEVLPAINKSILYGKLCKEQPGRELTIKAIEQIEFNKAQLTYAFKYVLPLEVVREDGFSNILERRFRELEIDIGVDKATL